MAAEQSTRFEKAIGERSLFPDQIRRSTRLCLVYGNYSRSNFTQTEAHAHGHSPAGDFPHMARSRNPRFAPEFLEKKLSPTLIVPVTIVAVARFDDPEPLPPDSPDTPPLPPHYPTPFPILPGATAH